MSAAAVKKALPSTTFDLLALPGDGKGFEILDGELTQKETSGEHARAQTNLTTRLNSRRRIAHRELNGFAQTHWTCPIFGAAALSTKRGGHQDRPSEDHGADRRVSAGHRPPSRERETLSALLVRSFRSMMALKTAC